VKWEELVKGWNGNRAKGKMGKGKVGRREVVRNRKTPGMLAC
jgi:hypothetical protein